MIYCGTTLLVAMEPLSANAKVANNKARTKKQKKGRKKRENPESMRDRIPGTTTEPQQVLGVLYADDEGIALRYRGIALRVQQISSQRALRSDWRFRRPRRKQTALSNTSVIAIHALNIIIRYNFIYTRASNLGLSTYLGTQFGGVVGSLTALGDHL